MADGKIAHDPRPCSDNDIILKHCAAVADVLPQPRAHGNAVLERPDTVFPDGYLGIDDDAVGMGDDKAGPDLGQGGNIN